MKVTIDINTKLLDKIEKEAENCLIKTADAIRGDLVQSQTIPFGDTIKETEIVYGARGRYKKDGTEYKGKQVEKTVYVGGTLQRSAFIDDDNASKGEVSIVYDTPYARRLYYHPEYNFNKKQNKNAGGLWFAPYIDGSKKDFAKNTFASLLEKELKR